LSYTVSKLVRFSETPCSPCLRKKQAKLFLL